MDSNRFTSQSLIEMIEKLPLEQKEIIKKSELYMEYVTLFDKLKKRIGVIMLEKGSLSDIELIELNHKLQHHGARLFEYIMR